MRKLALGIDVGTTALKVVLLDPEHGIVGQAERAHTLHSAFPGWAEEDPNEWWATTCAAVRELTAQVKPGRIAVVGVTGMVPALVLQGPDGVVLRRSIQQNDARSVVEVEELRAAVDPEEFLQRTGGLPNQQNVAPRWRWLVKHEPAVAARCATLCGSYDFIAQRLTGVRTLELNWAAESGLFDVVVREWITPYLQDAGIAAEILPEVRSPTDVVGGVHSIASEVTGLPVGTPVIAGSADHVAAALAVGLTSPGDVLLKFGGAGDILAVTAGVAPLAEFYFDFHDIPGLSLTNGCMAASGSLVRWFAAEFGGGRSLAELDAEAAATPVGSGGIVALPYALGEKTPIFDLEARAVFAGVMLHHTRGHLFRSVLEAVSYGFAHHVDLLRTHGRPVRRILAADGGSRSALWMQMTSDVLGEPLQVVTGTAASALGVAFVAGMSVGLFRDWNEVERFAVRGPRYEPDAVAHQRYLTGYAIYRDLYVRLRTLFPELRKLEGV